MSSAPFDIDLVIARLAAEISPLQQVRGAADYATLTGIRDFRPPEAFALVLTEQAAGADPARPGTGVSAPAGVGRQVAATEFGVVLAIRNVRYQRGAPALQDAGPLIGQVRDALIGWLPPGLAGARPCKWLRGYIIDYDAGTLLWADEFTTQHFIGRTTP